MHLNVSTSCILHKTADDMCKDTHFILYQVLQLIINCNYMLFFKKRREKNEGHTGKLLSRL